jgi:hypothetical protein
MITMISYDKILGCHSWRWVLPVLVSSQVAKGLIFNIYFFTVCSHLAPPLDPHVRRFFDLAPTFLFGAKISPVCSYLFQSSFWILFNPPGGEKLEQVDPKGGFKMETVNNFLNIFFRGLPPPLSLLKKWGPIANGLQKTLDFDHLYRILIFKGLLPPFS